MCGCAIVGTGIVFVSLKQLLKSIKFQGRFRTHVMWEATDAQQFGKGSV